MEQGDNEQVCIKNGNASNCQCNKTEVIYVTKREIPEEIKKVYLYVLFGVPAVLLAIGIIMAVID